ncbi:MAG: hypothetical protein ABIQ55_05750 [Gemmatimonadaceae bacterium]
MNIKKPLSSITEKVSPQRRKQLENAARVTVGAVAAAWMVLRLRRELYGPGGSKMSRYQSQIDKVWKRD